MRRSSNNPLGQIITWLRSHPSPAANALLESYRSNYFSLSDGEIAAARRLMDAERQSIASDVKKPGPGFYIDQENGLLYRVVARKNSPNDRHVSWRLTSSRRWVTKNVDILHVYDLVVSGQAQPLTEEEAIRIGLATGVCAICGRLLSDKKSVKSGVGPQCRKQLKSPELIGE